MFISCPCQKDDSLSSSLLIIRGLIVASVITFRPLAVSSPPFLATLACTNPPVCTEYGGGGAWLGAHMKTVGDF